MPPTPTTPKTRSRPSKPKPVPPTTVLYVRHGQTPTTGAVLPGRAKGLHLAEAGHHQAQRVAQRIAELKQIAAHSASPLERARETGAPIGVARGQKVQVDRRPVECDFGEW